MAELNLFQHSREAVDVAQGDTLFREGDHGDVMFAVVGGEIGLTSGDSEFACVGPGGVVGELALIDAGPRTATATANVASRVVPVDEHRFKYLVQEHPTFALEVMRIMAERIRLSA